MKKIIFCVFLLMFLLMQGCQMKEDSGSLSSELVKLRIIVPSGHLKKVTPFFEEYQSNNPYIVIETEEIADADIHHKISLAHASNADYDLMWVDGSVFHQYAKSELEPLDEYLKQSPIDLLNNYNQSIASLAKLNGKVYGIPIALGTRVLAYNKKLLNKYGLNAPRTQGEIIDVSRFLFEEKGIYGMARSYANPDTTLYQEGAFWMSNGGQIFERNPDKTFTALCHSKEMIDSIVWWQKMTEYMPKDVNLSESAVRNLFASGDTAFYIFAPWEFFLLGSMNYGYDYELINIPGTEPVSTLNAWFLSIGSGSRNKMEAWRLMETYLADPEKIAATSVSLPGDLRAYDYPPFNETRYRTFKNTLEKCEIPMPITPQFQKIASVFVDSFNMALIEGIDASKVMEQTSLEIQYILDSR